MLFALPFTAKSQGIYDERAAENVIWEGKLKKQVEYLCDTICEGRATGTAGHFQAAFHIISKFKKYGLTPFGESYAMSFATADSIRIGHNIIGMVPGSKKRPMDSYIIIGAHYDHLGILGERLYPGADSNASGVVAMMSLAEMFSAMKMLGKVYSSSIIFVAFDAHELGLAGSYALWEKISAGKLIDPYSGRPITKEKIRCMVNIDQIGSSLEPLASGREDFIIALGTQTIKPDDSDWLGVCNRFYKIDLEIAKTYYGSDNFTKLFYRLSDQRVFVDNKVPVVLFTSGITLNTNKTYDRPQSLNYPVLRRRIMLIYHWIEKMI